MELIVYLRARYGTSNVLASDVKFEPAELVGTGPYKYLDVTDEDGECSLSHSHRFFTCTVHPLSYVAIPSQLFEPPLLITGLTSSFTWRLFSLQ